MATGEAAAEEELNLANTTYSRKMYDYAIQGYEKFLITYPSAKGRDTALFRLAECHRMLGNEEAARDGYERLCASFMRAGSRARERIDSESISSPKRNTIPR